MSNIPKTRVRQIVGRDAFTPFFGPTRHRWEVTIDGHTLIEFNTHRTALAYAHSYATKAQRQHVEKLERAAYEATRRRKSRRQTTQRIHGPDGPDLGPRRMTNPNPCATCRIRDHWCCDPWETPQDHEQDTSD